MMVSIVIPTYNSITTLPLAIDSCLGQTFPHIEIIVVDDGSTDNTLLWLNELKLIHHNIRVIAIEHSGVTAAFNRGLEESTGEYSARMDADDIMHPEKIAKQVKFLEDHPEVGVVSCLVQHGGDRETQEGYSRHIDWINSLVTHEQIALNRFIDSPVCNPTVMFRGELVEKYGAAREGDFPEDYEMWLRWMDAGVRFAKIPEVLFTWNDLSTRLTRNDKRYSPEAFERAKTLYLIQFIQENNKTNRPLYLCGSGRITRKKSELLLQSEMRIGGFLEIDESKCGKEYNGIPVIHFRNRPDALHAYIVNYVSVRGVREELRNAFLSENRQESQDFIMAG
jgi:glycosyltransferase involved in cell wall biosynthesis